MELQIGMRVQIIEDSKIAEESYRALNGAKGIIVHLHESGQPRIGIEFDEEFGGHDCSGRAKRGYGFYVYESDVIVLSEPLEEGRSVSTSKIEEEWLPERFTFAGQRVMLNPESDLYQRRRDKIADGAGWVVNHNASDGDLRIILRNGSRHMKNWNVDVQFDNEYRENIPMKDLLLIDARKDAVSYVFHDGARRTIVEGVNEKLIDELVIQGGRKVRERKVMDKAWVDKKISTAYQDISDGKR